MLRADGAAGLRSNLSLAGAGSVLIGTTAAVIVLGALVGWAFGSAAWGFLVGAILGIPVGVWAVVHALRSRALDDGRNPDDATADAEPAAAARSPAQP